MSSSRLLKHHSSKFFSRLLELVSTVQPQHHRFTHSWLVPILWQLPPELLLLPFCFPVIEELLEA